MMEPLSRRSLLTAGAGGTVLAAGLPRAFAASVSDAKAGEFTFASDAIRIERSRPSAVVLEGAEQFRIVSPGSPVSRRSSSTLSPAGRIQFEEYAWRSPAGYGLRWRLGKLDNGQGMVIGAAFHNGTEVPVRLRSIRLLGSESENVLCAGDPASWLLSTVDAALRVGSLAEVLPAANDRRWGGFGLPAMWRLTEQQGSDGHWRFYEDFLTLYTDEGRKGLFFAPAGPPRADLWYECRVEAGRMLLNVVSQMSDVVLDPGEVREAQQLAILAGPYETAAETAFRWLASTHGSSVSKPPMFGWCSWYDRLDKITAADIELVADAAEGFRARLPFDVIQIDMGYERAWGDWRPNEKFPAGLLPAVEKIRRAGAKPGIWLTPIAVTKNAHGLFDNHPDWFQKTSSGRAVGTPGKEQYLDPTHPQTQAFLREIIRDKRRDGFEYFKIDYNNISAETRFHNSKKTRLEAYRDLYRLYREEMGDCFLLACAGFQRGVVGFADAARIGWDSRAWWVSRPGGPPISILEALRCTGQSSAANRILFSNDPDVTYLLPRDTLTAVELRTWHGFVGLLGGMALISEPVYKQEYKEQLRLAEILNPPAPDVARSLNAGTDRDHQQFGFIAQRPWGDFATLLAWNGGAEPRSISVREDWLSRIGSRFHVWSLWDERYLGVHGPSFHTGVLAPRESAILRFTPLAANDRAPLLTGSNLHISCGSAEVADFRSTASRVEIQLSDAGAREGALYLHSPGVLALRGTEGLSAAALERLPDGIWKVNVSGRLRGAAQSISLSIAG